MAKGKWKRDFWTGLPVEWVPERLKDDAGHFVPPAGQREGWLWCVRSIAALGGMRPDTFHDRVLTDPTSPIHLEPLRDENGRALSYGTHVSSAEAGFRNYRTAADQRMKAGKKPTDVSGGGP